MVSLSRTKAMTSLNRGLFSKLDKSDYICREICDIYKEEVNGHRSYYPEFTGKTVYRAGGVEESWQGKPVMKQW